ncbi:FkbM family methyltransferase [Methylobacterium sp. P31]
MASIKAALPRALFHWVKNTYNRWRYRILWLRRRTISFAYQGEVVKLCIVDPKDYIQKTQLMGRFYEETELQNIKAAFPKGGVFLDIGSNTGQHAVFVAKFCGACEVIVVEPIPEAIGIIRENVKLNHLQTIVDTSMLGVALGEAGGRMGYNSFFDNLGGTILKESKSGVVRVESGDTLLRGRRVDFIKIDTEGFEMKVLAGLEQTILANRPKIFIEVDKSNVPSFLKMMERLEYEAIFKKEYQFNWNYIMQPRRQASA